MLAKHSSRLAFVSLVVLIVALALPGLALAQDGTDGQVSVFESVTIEPGQVVNGDVGSIFSSVSVLGTVNGNVFSIFSSVSVSGQGKVTGNAFSIFSSVDVSGNAVVQGDATSALSSVNVNPPARVLGMRSSGFGNINLQAPRGGQFNFGPWNLVGDIFSGIFSALILAAVGAVAVALFPQRVRIIRDTLVKSPGPSVGVGCLAWILILPLALILIITLCGPFLLGLGAFLATLLGMVAVGLLVGERVMETSAYPSRSMVTDVVVGSLIVGLLLAALNIIPFFCCFNWIVYLAVFSWALGAVLLSRFGGVPPAVVARPMPPAAYTPPAYTPPAPPAEPQAQPPAEGETTPPAPPAGEEQTPPSTPTA